MIALTAVLFWMLTDPTFRITPQSVTFDGLVHADEAAVRSHLSGIDRGPNVFRVRAKDIVGDVSSLPDVDAARATVSLPAAISIHLEERQPLFVWSDGDVAWLVDEDGMLFGPTVSAPTSPPDGSDQAGVEDASQAAVVEDEARAGLPVVEDARLPEVAPTVGSHLPAADLMVMRQLLALTPQQLGSRAQKLQLRVDQNLGYVLHSDESWLAIFGRYTPRVQPPDVIPRQVQCLRSLLAGKDERKLERIRLSISDDACGTFTERGA
jgi:POTRA domain, FtsQ-type